MKALSLFLGLFLLAGGSVAAAPRHTTEQTFTGTCTEVTVMNVVADPTLCSDTATVIRRGRSAIGYAFTLKPPGQRNPCVVSFIGEKPDRDAKKPKGALTLQVYRIHFTIDGRTDNLVAVGSCIITDSHRKLPGHIVCSATTVNGDFVSKFASRDFATGSSDGRKDLTTPSGTL